MQVVYLADEDRDDPPPPYRTGEAGNAWLGESGRLETDTRVRLNANSAHALLGHGVVDALNELPLEGRLGTGQPVVVPPAVLDDARRVFIEADRQTYGARYEFVAGTSEQPEPIEFRIRIDNREYQSTLARLTHLASQASREGRAVWLRL
jgi:hypothetical protein